MEVNLGQLVIGLVVTVFSVAFGILGWFARRIAADLREVEKANIALREKVIDEYVKKDDLAGVLREIKDALTKIFEKLDQKQDKE